MLKGTVHSEMAPAEIRLIRQVVIKERGAEFFLEKSTRPPPPQSSESPLNIRAPTCFLIANLPATPPPPLSRRSADYHTHNPILIVLVSPWDG